MESPLPSLRAKRVPNSIGGSVPSRITRDQLELTHHARTSDNLFLKKKTLFKQFFVTFQVALEKLKKPDILSIEEVKDFGDAKEPEKADVKEVGKTFLHFVEVRSPSSKSWRRDSAELRGTSLMLAAKGDGVSTPFFST